MGVLELADGRLDDAYGSICFVADDRDVDVVAVNDEEIPRVLEWIAQRQALIDAATVSETTG